MARDAIARQFDVEKNTVELYREPGKGGYLPGTITFFAKKGKSVRLDQIEASLRATRLSGGTNMHVKYLEITATGDTVLAEKDLVFKVKGMDQQFLLGEDKGTPTPDGKPTPLSRLRTALERGDRVVSVTGRVPGWTGRFPLVLRELADAAREKDARKAKVLLVTDFQVAGK